MRRHCVSPRFAFASLAATLPLVGVRALAAEGRPQDEWDRLKKTVFGLSDLVGQVSARRLTYRNLPAVTDVRGQVRIMGRSWRFENVTADICGGRASADAAIDLPLKRNGGERRFHLKANVAGVRLEDLTRLYDYEVMRGFVSGNLEIGVTLPPSRPVINRTTGVVDPAGRKGSLHGRAEFHIRDADLGSLPFAIKAVSFIFLGFPRLQKEVISQADGHLTLTPRGLVFQDLSLRSETGTFSIEAERNGTITYKGEIDLYFRPVFAEGFTKVIPGLSEIIDAVRGRGGRVRVTGTIKEPKFKWGAFR